MPLRLASGYAGGASAQEAPSLEQEQASCVFAGQRSADGLADPFAAAAGVVGDGDLGHLHAGGVGDDAGEPVLGVVDGGLVAGGGGQVPLLLGLVVPDVGGDLLDEVAGGLPLAVGAGGGGGGGGALGEGPLPRSPRGAPRCSGR
ncbi:hypothetical protein BN2537_17217 [Streptomyces venezuelae]|nr:hypothetical protein BN2537_17217 [Streptomyces venezuelae]